MSIIEIQNVSFGYTNDLILKGLNLGIADKSFLAIAGPNGAGKSTLLNLLCDQLKPQTGHIKIEGREVQKYSTKKLAQKIAVVPQEHPSSFDFTVAETVMMARTPYLSTFGFETKTDAEIVSEALEITGIANFASRPLTKLSGGERQRVFIARALAQNTSILLLDEPTSFLDIKHQVGIYDLLKKTQLEKNKTIIMVTHDINLAVQYCDSILLLANDGAYYTGSAEELLTSEKIEGIFGVKTLAVNVGNRKIFQPIGLFSKGNFATPT